MQQCAMLSCDDERPLARFFGVGSPMRIARTLLVAALLISVAECTVPSLSTHVRKYSEGKPVPISVNTIGPYRNPNERYPFYETVPFCKPKKRKLDNAGSVFMGDRPRYSDYHLSFAKNMEEPETVCEMTLDQNQIKQYLELITNNYMFEFFVDHEILVTGFLGKENTDLEEQYQDGGQSESQYYLFTHWNFHCEYNGPYVISCRITTDLSRKVDLAFGEDIPVKFTYSYEWIENKGVPVNDRLMYHVRKLISSQPLDVHWLSILNSFILVILVTAFVALMFTRILKQDCARYHSIAADDLEDVEDPGWKQLQLDVFREPNNIMLFAACIGTGTQLLVGVISVLILSLIGMFYPGNRGALTSAVIFVYCFTAGVAGHVSGELYVQLGGTKWATNAVLTACLFPVPFFAIFSVVNTIAWYYGSTMVLPFSYIIGIITLWMVVTFPLTIFAAHRVKDTEPKLDVPIKSNRKVAREIPVVPWYRSGPVQIGIAGVLPFTAIYIELHFLFTAVFGHQVYTLFGILSLAFIMLLIVTAAVTIGLTYFQLQSEDWQWWWRSFCTAGSTGAYVLGYAVFYYHYRSYMNGTLQAAFFFGYIAALSYGFFLMLGAVGWWCTFLFLKRIYGAIRVD